MVNPNKDRRTEPARRRTLRAGALLLLLALVASACRISTDDVSLSGDFAPAESAAAGTAAGSSESGGSSESASSTTTAPTLTTTRGNCSAPSIDEPTGLNPAGQSMLARHVDSGAAVPSYQLAVDIEPATGAVQGSMRAAIPSSDEELKFRVFAGMDAFNSGLTITDATVDGEPVDAKLDRALVTVPNTTGDASAVVTMNFQFEIDQMAANENFLGSISGESLQPDQVGLLGRTETGMQLGHWFPVWLPAGTRTDPDPSGFGDIGAFPAANICATITAPQDYAVITGGSRVGTSDNATTESAAGLRDFAILLSNDLAVVEREVRGVQIRVWGPPDDVEALETVLGYAEQSHDALTDAFGPYPWNEVDIISAPLGAGVGGMEWPGAIWIERNTFAGGVAGLGDLGELFGDQDMSELLGAIGGEAISTSLEWVIAHELGHEWWHATVGNDSIASPAVDEPLAQLAACIAMQRIHPDNWQSICEAQTTDQYAQARSLGVNDTAAEQASDAFESSLQYGAVVYGKAPGFYFAAAELIGWNELTEALKAFVTKNSFALVATDALRDHLVEAAGENGQAIGELWDRWFRQAKGDEDIEPADLLGAFGGADAAGLEGLDDLAEIFGEGSDFAELFGEDANLDELFGEGSGLGELFGEDANLDELLGEDSELLEQMLEDLLSGGGN